MNRQFNFRFTLGLAVVLAAVGGGLYLLHGWQVKANAGTLKARSEKADADGDKWKAVSYLERYLGFQPGDKEASRRHATLLAEAAKGRPEQQRAYLAVEQVLRDNPADTDLRRKAADLALAIERPSDAKFHFEELLKGSPKDAELLDKLGLCEEQLGRIDQAIIRLKEARAIDPTRVDCYVRQARCYLRQDRPDQADTVMDELVANNPADAKAHVARSEYLRDIGQIAKGAEAAKQASKLAPGDRRVILQAAEMAAQQGRLDDARAEFAKGRKLFPDDLRFITGQAELDLNSGRREAAVEALKEAAQKGSDNLDNVLMLADLFVSAGEPVEARKLIAKIPRQGPLAAVAEFLDARLLMADQKWAAAATALTRSRPGLARVPEMALRAELMLAACYERLDRPDKRLEAAEAAAKLDPLGVAARMALADARQANGNADEALTGYLQLADRLPAARYTAAWLMMWQNRVRGSRAEWAAVQQLLDATPADQKKTAEYRLMAATLANVQGKRADARKLLEQGKADDPKERRYWVGLANLAMADGGPAAEKVLDEAEKAAGDGADFRLARIQTRLAQGGKADRLKPLEAGAEKWPAEDQERLLVGLADAYAAVGARADARRLTEELARRKPDSLAYQMRLFDQTAADNDPDKLTPLVDGLRKLEGDDGAVWRYAEAYRQAMVARRDSSPKAAAAARGLLAEVAARRPNWAQVPLLEGDLDERASNPDAAVEKYKRAIQLGTRSPVVIRRAASLLIARRRYDEARQLLADVPTAAAAPDVRRVAAELSAVTREPADDTLKLAAGAVPADTKNPADELWRGMILWSAGQPAVAEKAFRRAVDLGGTDPTTWGALIRFLVATDRKADAGHAITAAKAKVPADQFARALPQWQDMVGNRAEAAKQYEALYRAAPGDPRVVRELVMFHMTGGEMDKAEPLLRGLIEKSADPSGTAWARRTLALLLATKGEYRYGTEALALLEANLKDRPDTPEDQRLQAIILSARPGGRRQSIQILEASFARLRPAPAEEFLLAQLHEADGNWAKAKDRLLGVLSGSQAKNGQFLAYFIAALLKHKEVDAAAEWLARLEAAAGAADAPRVVEMKARVLVAKGQTMEAADLLGGFAEKLYASRQNNPLVYRAVGLLMAELKLNGPAEGMIRKYVTLAEGKNPLAPLDLAEFLARQNRVSDALDMVAKTAARGANPEVIGRAMVGVVRLGKPTEADHTRAAELMTAARKAAPGSADLPVSTADLLDARGRYAEAIAGYRDILAKDPGKAIALNNLAWLLALHEKKPDEALALANQAISTVGPQFLYLDTRGVVLLRAGKPEQAIQDFTAALEQAQRPDTLFHLAVAYDKLGNSTDARRWFKRAADAGLTDKDIHPLEVPDYQRLKGQFGG